MFRVAFIMSPMDSSYHLKEARAQLNKQMEDIIAVDFVDSYKMDTEADIFNSSMDSLDKADFIFILMHGGLNYFGSFNKVLEKFQGIKKFFIYTGLDDENRIMLPISGITQSEYNIILKYILCENCENALNLIKYLAAYYEKLNIEYDEPNPLSWEGLYHPVYDAAAIADNAKKAAEQGKPVIGIIFYTKLAQQKNTQHIDALIKQLEAVGAYPLAVYSSSAPQPSMGCKGIKWVINNIFMTDGTPLIDVIINTMGFSQTIMANPGDGSSRVEGSIFESLHVPVIQAMTTYQTYEDWKENLRGLDSMSFSGSVYYPEFDGQIITTTFAITNYIVDEISDKTIHEPIQDRVEHVSKLALNWAKLKKTKNENKKIAILFHNMPPRNDMIGCAFGLDTPLSVYMMIEALKKEGIITEYDFTDGDEIINRIINAVSNDTRWLPAEQAIDRSVDIIEGDIYRDWFKNLSQNVRNQLKRDWGDPPGEFMVHEDKLPVPGIINGNIFIGLQPPRGYEEKAEEVYHSTHIVPPHQYISYYHWIKNIFQADVILHVGTHGTLEWLPGKEIGLSEDCYPDVTIRDIPHLYPYSITVLGEGIQAKRRSNAVILDHLIPSMMLSGTYEEMEELDDLIKQYYQAKQLDKGKLEILQESIIEIVEKNDYHTDLNLIIEDIRNDFAGFMDMLHNWMEDIKNTLVKDGLHIFGTIPQEDRLHNLVCALLRLSNGEILSLTEATCRACGIDYKVLNEHPLDMDDRGKTNLMILSEMEQMGMRIIEEFIAVDFDTDLIEKVIQKHLKSISQKDINDLKNVLIFTANTIIPKLNGTIDEIKNLIEGINGRFVPPGAGGSPTRGNVSILPSGRNFYSIDPNTVPSRAAWQVGKQLGDKLIERYMKDEGKMPEAAVIVVYGGETMKTLGDDIAQALYLMGIQPIWLKNSDKVIGLEPITFEELKRPRMDITLRISGLFRDTFPNLIELVEDGVNIAAALEESDEENFIRRNFKREVTELVEQGISMETAQQEAGMRIFSDPPGTYGAGVDSLINSKNWANYTDLGNIYTFWGGYAYGKNFHGQQVTQVFSRRLSNAQITIKNESSMEIDMLESDDFYNYHGGLIAAVRTKSGKKPRSYCGDSSDPTKVKLNDVREQSAKIMRSRILNPKWFDGMKQHGYKGAQEISGMMDFVFGWDATSDIIEDWMYEKISENFLFNEERREWIKSVNPWAIQNMLERLLEAQQRGMWEAKDDTLEKLRGMYVEIEGDIEEYI